MLQVEVVKKKQGDRLNKWGLEGSRFTALGHEVLEVDEEEELEDPMISKLAYMNLKSNQDRSINITDKKKYGKAPVETQHQ